jgi:hypothetical protein
MKRFVDYIKENLICEHFLTLTKKEDMKKYGEEVWDILQKSYAYIGGIAGINSIDDLIEDTDLWKLVRRDNKITAIKAYKLKNGGRKSNCGGTDGTIQGKKDIMKIYQEDGLMKDRHQYGEYSGKAVSTVLKTGGIPVPAAIAQTILEPKKIEICQDGWFYIRKLGDGKSHHKLMIGNLPNGKYNDEKPSEELIHILKELAKKYYAEDEKNNNK